jgi:glutamyl-tRNA reductase
VRAVVAERNASALVLLDLGVPRNIDPAVRTIPHVRLIDLDDLECLRPHEIARRRAEIDHAELLAVQAAQAIARWLRVRAIGPAIVELRSQGDAIRSLELRRAAQQLAGLTPEQHSAVEQLTEAIVKKLLHGPTVALRNAAADSSSPESSQRVLEVLRFDQARHIQLQGKEKARS